MPNSHCSSFKTRAKEDTPDLVPICLNRLRCAKEEVADHKKKEKKAKAPAKHPDERGNHGNLSYRGIESCKSSRFKRFSFSSSGKYWNRGVTRPHGNCLSRESVTSGSRTGVTYSRRQIEYSFRISWAASLSGTFVSPTGNAPDQHDPAANPEPERPSFERSVSRVVKTRRYGKPDDQGKPLEGR